MLCRAVVRSASGELAADLYNIQDHLNNVFCFLIGLRVACDACENSVSELVVKRSSELLRTLRLEERDRA
eukprot:5808842-Prymnesium_polylepis.1